MNNIFISSAVLKDTHRKNDTDSFLQKRVACLIYDEMCTVMTTLKNQKRPLIGQLVS